MKAKKFAADEMAEGVRINKYLADAGVCSRRAADGFIEDGKVFKTKYLSAQLGTSRLSFAPPEYMEEFLDITPGAASIMGLMNAFAVKAETAARR